MGNIWVNRSQGKRGCLSDIPIGDINCDNIKVKNITADTITTRIIKIGKWTVVCGQGDDLEFWGSNTAQCGAVTSYVMGAHGGSGHNCDHQWILKGAT